MKTILLMIAIGAGIAGCGSSEAPPPAPVVDAGGVEMRDNGTKIARTENGDK